MKQFGLIGKSLKHSFSRKYFQEKFQSEGIEDHYYELFELERIDDLLPLLQQNSSLKGFNVTIPYKESILPYLDEIDQSVEEIGACNCVKIVDGKLYGTNTDSIGFLNSFLPLVEMQHHSALILGNGGSSKAIVYTLEQCSIECTIIARNPKSNNELEWNSLTTGLIQNHKVIINTTPIGMWPQVNDFPGIPYEEIDRFHLIYDLIYNPEKTIFLQKAEARNAIIKNGLEMLELQAEASWSFWNS